jgi:hypothetical protein
MVLERAVFNTHYVVYEVDKSGKKSFFPKVKDLTEEVRIGQFERLMDLLSDSFALLPADRYLTTERGIRDSETEMLLSPKTFKQWLLKLSLSRSGHDAFEEIKTMFASKPFSFGEIGFSKERDEIEIMVKDGNVRLPVSKLGSGRQQILYIIGSLVLNKRKMVGIEELEINLSPSRAVARSAFSGSPIWESRRGTHPFIPSIRGVPILNIVNRLFCWTWWCGRGMIGDMREGIHLRQGYGGQGKKRAEGRSVARVAPTARTRRCSSDSASGKTQRLENMCFCETNRIQNGKILNGCAVTQGSCEEQQNFSNPVRFSGFGRLEEDKRGAMETTQLNPLPQGERRDPSRVARKFGDLRSVGVQGRETLAQPVLTPVDATERVPPIKKLNTTSDLLVGEDAAGFVEEDAAEVHLEGFGVGRFEERFLFGDQFGFHEFEERLVEGLHTFVGAGFDGGEKFVEAIFFDKFADGAGVEHDLDGRNDTAGGRRNEALANDGAQGGGHLAANLVAFVRGKEIEGAADGRVGRGRVQGGQHQMARVRGGEGGHEGLAVAHFADDDDVGILAHDVDEGAFEAERIEADFTLFDDGLFVVEHILDGVFERDDVALFGFVDVLDHRRQCAGFAAARGARDQDDAALGAGDFAELLRQAQIMEAWYVCFDVPHHEGGQAALIKDIYTEAAKGRVDVRKISFLLALEAGLEMFRKHEVDDFRDLFRSGRIDLDGEQFARDADGGVVARLHMNVRSRHVDGELQQTVEVFHTVSGRSRY